MEFSTSEQQYFTYKKVFGKYNSQLEAALLFLCG